MISTERLFSTSACCISLLSHTRGSVHDTRQRPRQAVFGSCKTIDTCFAWTCIGAITSNSACAWVFFLNGAKWNVPLYFARSQHFQSVEPMYSIDASLESLYHWMIKTRAQWAPGNLPSGVVSHVICYFSTKGRHRWSSSISCRLANPNTVTIVIWLESLEKQDRLTCNHLFRTGASDGLALFLVFSLVANPKKNKHFSLGGSR